MGARWGFIERAAVATGGRQHGFFCGTGRQR